MEVQLEEEYEDKQKVLREKRELESKLTTLSDQVSAECRLEPGQPPAPSRLWPGVGVPWAEVRGLGTGKAVLGSGEPPAIRMGVIVSIAHPGFSHWPA